MGWATAVARERRHRWKRAGRRTIPHERRSSTTDGFRAGRTLIDPMIEVRRDLGAFGVARVLGLGAERGEQHGAALQAALAEHAVVCLQMDDALDDAELERMKKEKMPRDCCQKSIEFLGIRRFPIEQFGLF